MLQSRKDTLTVLAKYVEIKYAHIMTGNLPFNNVASSRGFQGLFIGCWNKEKVSEICYKCTRPIMYRFIDFFFFFISTYFYSVELVSGRRVKL